MNEIVKTVIGCAVLGLGVSGALALPSFLPVASAVADEQPMKSLLRSTTQLFPKQLDGSVFVKPDWTVEPWVSTEATDTQTVRKISFGRTTFVTVATTRTGVYSSDAIGSPHIRYPGINGDIADATVTSDAAPVGLIGTWDGDRWAVQKSLTAGSFVTVVPFGGGQALIDENTACAFMANGSVYC